MFSPFIPVFQGFLIHRISNPALFQVKLGDEQFELSFELTCFDPKNRKRPHLELLMLHTPHANVYIITNDAPIS